MGCRGPADIDTLSSTYTELLDLAQLSVCGKELAHGTSDAQIASKGCRFCRVLIHPRTFQPIRGENKEALDAFTRLHA